MIFCWLLKRFGQHKIYDLCDFPGYCDFGQSRFVEFWENLLGFVHYWSPWYLFSDLLKMCSVKYCFSVPKVFAQTLLGTGYFHAGAASTHPKSWIVRCVGQMANRLKI